MVEDTKAKDTAEAPAAKTRARYEAFKVKVKLVVGGVKKEVERWGVRDAATKAVIHDTDFTELAAKRIAEMESGEEPPKSWARIRGLLRDEGIAIYPEEDEVASGE